MLRFIAAYSTTAGLWVNLDYWYFNNGRNKNFFGWLFEN